MARVGPCVHVFFRLQLRRYRMRARRGKKAMHGNSVIEFAGRVLSLSAATVYEGNEDRAPNGAQKLLLGQIL